MAKDYQSVITKQINNLKRKLKKGNYENFGQKELKAFDAVVMADKELSFLDKCKFLTSFANQLEAIQ